MDTLIMSKFRRVLCIWSFSLVLLFVPLKAICQIAVPSWVNDIGGSSSNCISSTVQVDQQNNIFVTGFFSNTADFDPSSGVYNLTASGAFDTFLAKYTPAGKLIWAERIGGSDYTQVNSMSIDENGNPIICGQFDSGTDFDPGTGSTVLNPQGYDAFVAKYDTNGKFIWARNIGGPNTDYGSHVSTDSKGDVIACIRYQSTVTIGRNTVGGSSFSNTYTGGNGFNGLTVKYDPNGNFLWGINVPDPVNSEMFTSIDNLDNVLIGGHFTGNDNFNPLGTAYNMNGAGNSGFVAKYTPAGILVWANSFTGVQTDVNVGTDSENNIVVVGTFSLPLTFNGTTLSPQGNQDIFLSKFTPAGVFQSLKDIGNPGANSIFIYSVVAKANNVYITGYFNGTIDFDPSPASQALVSYHGQQDFFFAKYDADFNYNWAFSGGSPNCSQSLGRNVAIDNTNNVLITGGFCSTVNFSPLGCTAYPLTAQSFGSRDCFLGKYVQNVASAAGQITSFAVPQQSAPAVIDQTNLKITVTVPAGTDVTALVPTIGYTTGVTLNPASGTVQNFTSNVTYNLSGSCATTLNYTVNVIVASGPTCPTIPAPTVSSNSVQVCAGTMATLSVSNPQSGLTYNWYSSATSTTILATGSTISVAPSSTIPSYFVEGVNINGCEGARTEVDVTSVPISASPVIPAQTICSGSPATLIISQPQSGITYNWYDAATGGTLLATGVQYTTTALTSTTTFYTEADNATGCSSARTATVITVNQPPQAPASFAQNVCTGGTATLTLANAQAGTTYNWYDSAAKTNLLFTGTSYTTGIIDANTTYYVEASNASCPPSALTSINVTIVPPPAAPVVANNPQAVCASYQDLVLNVDNPQVGYIYNWYSSVASTTPLANGVSYDAATLNPTNTYYVEAVNSTGCISPRTAVTITVNPEPGMSTYNAFICPGDATATVKAVTDDANATISWYADSNGNTFLATGSSLTVPGNINAIYYARSVDNTTGCTRGYTPALIKLFPQLAAPVVSVGTITSTSLTFNWGAVQDATGYQVSIDNGQTFITPSSGSTGLSHTITGLQPGQKVSIVVQALGSSACQLSTSSSAVTAIVQYPQEDLIYVANAFTPNGDGNNDVVYVHSQGIKSMTFYIYDQWGEMLFESTSQAVGWDGTYKGKKQPVGVYVYYVKAVMNDGHQLTKKGTITLLK
jgi:gliding motility-associated-like protein